MWRTIRTSLVVVAMLGGGNLWAVEKSASQAPQRPGPTKATGQAPQGPGPTSDAGRAALDVVNYKPIPTSMLPVDPTAPMTSTAPAQPATLPGQSDLAGLPVAQPTGPYTLGRNDVVHIEVTGQPDFSGDFVVNYDGKIQYGALGDISANGLTKEQLTQVLTEALKKYVRVPAVIVTITGFNSQAIYILGEVARPGKYAMRGDSIKIRDALIAAGLFTTSAALGRVHVIKSDPNNPTYKVLNLDKVFYEGKMQQDIDLVNGDIVVVPATVWSKITGFIASVTNPASHARTVAWLATL